MTDKTLLHPGGRFPALTLALTGGGILRLPDYLTGHFNVILFYRGSWCPYCSVYSSGAIRRLLPDDVIGLVRYLREQANASQPPSAAPTPQRTR